MKYIIILGDGMADHPVAELGAYPWRLPANPAWTIWHARMLRNT